MSRFSYFLSIVLVVAVFTALFVRLYVVALTDNPDNRNLSNLETSIKSKTDVLPSHRGSVYDSNGNVLAESIYSYRIIAYVDPIRSEGLAKPVHVTDVTKTAKAIANILELDSKKLESTLNKAIDKNRYITYLGTGTSDISVIQKNKIVEQNLPGIEFEQKESRSYPYGDFASYQIGYAKYNDKTDDGIDNGELVGELGVEKSFNDVLSGNDGYHKYIADANGVKIPNTAETIVDPKDGSSVYLTLDKDIQLILEKAVKDVDDEYNSKVSFMLAADAKTGEILGVSSTPSFDPNIKNLESYINPLHEQTLEPGSTMKTFTYASAIEEGVYNGKELYDSSKYVIYDSTIRNWKYNGWGRISFDRGYYYSSNVATSVLAVDKLGNQLLYDYYDKLGFGKKMGFDLPGEVGGDVSYDYPIDEATASFGQGITITPIQMLQALTTLTNNGDMYKPYIVDKVVSSSGDVTYKGKKELVAKNVFSDETVNQILNLMQEYVQGEYRLNDSYMFPEYGLVGKTGTAQIADSNGKYLTGANNYTFSFTGIFPKEDPKIILYAFVKQPTHNGYGAVSKLVQETVPNIGNLYDISTTRQKNTVNSTSNYMLDYTNMLTNDAKQILKQNSASNYIILGSGKKIVNQYPNVGVEVSSYTPAYLVTDGPQRMPNLVGLSYRDAQIICDLLGLDVTFDGTGFVKSQSIAKDKLISANTKLVVKLE